MQSTISLISLGSLISCFFVETKPMMQISEQLHVGASTQAQPEGKLCGWGDTWSLGPTPANPSKTQAHPEDKFRGWGNAISLGLTPAANPSQEIQSTEEPVITTEESPHSCQNMNSKNVPQPLVESSSNTIRSAGRVMGLHTVIRNDGYFPSSHSNFYHNALIGNTSQRQPFGSPTSHPNPQKNSQARRPNAASQNINVRPKIMKNPIKTQRAKLPKERTLDMMISNTRVIERSTTENMPATNRIAVTDVESQENSEVLELSRMTTPMSRRKWLEPSAELERESKRLRTVYAYLEVLGKQLMKRYKVDHDEKIYDQLEIGKYRQNVAVHTIRSVVTYIFTINDISEPPLYKNDEEIKEVLNNAVLKMERFWQTLQDPNIVEELGTTAHPMDPSNSFFLLTSFIKRTIKSSPFRPNYSNSICSSLFLMWLKDNQKEIYQNFSETTGAHTFKPYVLTIIHEYIMSTASEHVSRKILELFKSRKGYKGTKDHRDLTCRLKASFKMNWKKPVLQQGHS